MYKYLTYPRLYFYSFHWNSKFPNSSVPAFEVTKVSTAAENLALIVLDDDEFTIVNKDKARKSHHQILNVYSIDFWIDHAYMDAGVYYRLWSSSEVSHFTVKDQIEDEMKGHEVVFTALDLDALIKETAPKNIGILT